MKRAAAPLITVLLALPLAACGTAPVHSAAPRYLRPTGMLGKPGAKTPETLRAKFSGQAKPDTLHVRAAAQGSGTLTVTTAAGRTLWRLPNVAWASVLLYGRTHLPVVLVQSSYAYCGSGGLRRRSFGARPARHATSPA